MNRNTGTPYSWRRAPMSTPPTTEATALACPRASRAGSALVEEPLFEQPCALFRRDLDVARGEQEHLVGDPLHPAVECVGQAAREVDQALGQVVVGVLQVQDHGNRVLELVGNVLDLVEVLGRHEMDAIGATPAVSPAA